MSAIAVVYIVEGQNTYVVLPRALLNRICGTHYRLTIRAKSRLSYTGRVGIFLHFDSTQVTATCTIVSTHQ